MPQTNEVCIKKLDVARPVLISILIVDNYIKKLDATRPVLILIVIFDNYIQKKNGRHQPGSGFNTNC